ncbi:hypothetical protein [Phormidesmis priestleyi]
MLVFIVPIKSPKVAASWERVCQLFERCVRSICSQTSTDFQIIAVCNEKPKIDFDHPNLHYLEVDLPQPGKGHPAKDVDKAKKIIAGLVAAQQFSPSHSMAVDADDCVSQHLAKFVSEYPDHQGWFVDRGYVYQEDSSLIYLRKSSFQHWCGTCRIVRYDFDALLEAMNDRSDDLISFYANHKDLISIASRSKKSLERLPFTGVIYIIGNRENIYQKGFHVLHSANRGKLFFKLKDMLSYRPVTRQIREEFGLYSIESLVRNV